MVYNPIHLIRNGEETILRHAEYYPAYLMIPPTILAGCPHAFLRNLPRRTCDLVLDPKALEAVEGPFFVPWIGDAYAYMIWPYLMPGIPREAYSGYEPSWRFAHCAAIWIQALRDNGLLVGPQVIFDRPNCFKTVPYYKESYVTSLLRMVLPLVTKKYHFYDMVRIAEEHRCFEDFDAAHPSTMAVDFYRQWYHTRTKHPQISLESFQEDYRSNHNGKEWEQEDDSVYLEEEVLSQEMVDSFTATLKSKDREILNYRLAGLTLEEIAEKMEYKNHTAVLKRIKKIGLLYEDFSGEDLGFDGKRII